MAIAPQAVAPTPESPTGTDQTYADLLRLHALLAASRSDADASHMALFLVPHQVAELVFSLMQRRLDDAGAALAARDGRRAAEMVRPLPALMRTVEAQFDTLHALSPAAFESVREAVGSASGIQSAQWRRIEYTCGRRDRRHLTTAGWDADDRATLLDQLARPSLTELFTEFTADPGEDPDNARWATPIRSDLLTFDHVVVRWRRAHVVIAARFVGGRPGTAGTTGVDYLRATAEHHLFPNLTTSPHPKGAE
ncbi:tryptophan 2,3-dioxygenase family protein [Streptomyces sp. NPDC050428]|uniref:tryptophan 2,3-dioxygenase family protein n=1 Tax=Streptomyces sp. NPDC050428 TaxID=3155757 RepID=UPI0034325BC5